MGAPTDAERYRLQRKQEEVARCVAKAEDESLPWPKRALAALAAYSIMADTSAWWAEVMTRKEVTRD